MSHFAEIDSNNIVKKVIVADQDFIDFGIIGDPANWIQTSYNIKGGDYRFGSTPEEKLINKNRGTDKDKAARSKKNYAGIGFTYDQIRNAFIPPTPYPSWFLNEQTCLWEAPVLYPNDGKDYKWDEKSLSWKVI